MNSRQIECFLAAARHLNFTRAAEAMMLPQPAVSRYISTLENELGAPLFDRVNNRKVVLTEAGKRYFNFFQRFSLEFLRIQNMLSGGASVLRLGYNTGWNLAGFLPEVIRECRQLVPDFQVYLECLDFGNLINGLKEQQLDAVLSMENYLNQEADLEVSRITDLSRYIVYSDQLKGVDQAASPADFHAYDFFIVDDLRVWQICQEAEEMFQPYHFVPHFVTVRNLDTVIACVENGLGVAILDEWFSHIHADGIHAMQLDSSLRIALGRQGNIQMPIVDLFCDVLSDHFRQSGESLQ